MCRRISWTVWERSPLTNTWSYLSFSSISFLAVSRRLSISSLLSVPRPLSLCSRVLTSGGTKKIVVKTLEQRLKRSEEHTSELQSQSKLVCRLLLEKGKKRYHK